MMEAIWASEENVDGIEENEESWTKNSGLAGIRIKEMKWEK